MALNASNSNDLEQLALKGIYQNDFATGALTPNFTVEAHREAPETWRPLHDAKGKRRKWKWMGWRKWGFRKERIGGLTPKVWVDWSVLPEMRLSQASLADYVPEYIFRISRSNLYVKVVGSISRSQEQQGIHRHQTPPRYRNAASGSRLKVQPSTHRHTAHLISAKRDVIRKTGST